jgi:hypothetical protein
VARRLVCIRRTVAPPRRADYDAGWAGLQAAVQARGAHAWRFRSDPRPDLYLEFLEFAPGADPRDEPGVAAALRALDAAFGPGSVDEWRNADEEGAG